MYTVPLTVWSGTCETSVVKLKWSSVYFEDIVRDHTVLLESRHSEAKQPENVPQKSHSGADLPSRYKNNLSEFYAIDAAGTFYVWNLYKSVNVK